MSKPAVLMIGGVTHSQKEWEECASFATLKVSPPLEHLGPRTNDEQTFTGTTREEFLKECESGTYNDVVALYRSNDSTSVRWRIGSSAVGGVDNITVDWSI
jgi:glyoxylate reductase